MPLDEAVQKLKGPKGTQVNITIVRRGARRAARARPSPAPRSRRPRCATRYMIDAETGYFRSPTSPAPPAGGRRRHREAARAQGMKQLLLDLRNNGGGLLDQAIEVADQFLPEGATIVETRGRIRDSFQHVQGRGRAPTSSTCRSWCWSTAAPPRPRRSSPAPSRTTTSASSSARRPGARAWCRRSTASPTAPAWRSPRPSTTRRRAA